MDSTNYDMVTRRSPVPRPAEPWRATMWLEQAAYFAFVACRLVLAVTFATVSICFLSGLAGVGPMQAHDVLPLLPR